jgi:hypothetical protein
MAAAAMGGGVVSIHAALFISCGESLMKETLARENNATAHG